LSEYSSNTECLLLIRESETKKKTVNSKRYARERLARGWKMA